MDYDNDDDRELEDGQQPEDSTADGEPQQENLDPVAGVPEHGGAFATDAERLQMLRDGILEAKILGLLRRKGVPESAFDDVLQVTMISAFRARALPGGSGRERDNYVLTTAASKAADHRRNAGRQVELDEEADADGVAPAAPQKDLFIERDFLAKVLQVRPKDEDLLRIYKRYKLDEEPLTDIAAEKRLRYEPLLKRINDFEERLRKRARKMLKYGRVVGSLAALLLALGISKWELEPLPGMTRDTPGPISVLEPAVSTHIAETDPMDWAAWLRGQAFRACMNNQWRECLDDLAAAGQLDPDGNSDPTVQAARADAMKGYYAGLKPGPTWVPTGPRPYAKKAAR
jgi:hypothetical protein